MQPWLGNGTIAVTNSLRRLTGGRRRCSARQFTQSSTQAISYSYFWAFANPAARPTADHPFGHGLKLYFWAFVVAILIFALGAGVSIYQGVAKLQAPLQWVKADIAASAKRGH